MYYAIIGEDEEDSLPRRRRAREDHLARLRQLVDQGRLLVAGPMPAIDCADPGEAGFSGSLIVAAFDSLADARQWADADPYIAAGVYRSVVVKPYNPVLP